MKTVPSRLREVLITFYSALVMEKAKAPKGLSNRGQGFQRHA